MDISARHAQFKRARRAAPRHCPMAPCCADQVFWPTAIGALPVCFVFSCGVLLRGRSETRRQKDAMLNMRMAGDAATGTPPCASAQQAAPPALRCRGHWQWPGVAQSRGPGGRRATPRSGPGSDRHEHAFCVSFGYEPHRGAHTCRLAGPSYIRHVKFSFQNLRAYMLHLPELAEVGTRGFARGTEDGAATSQHGLLTQIRHW